ncbi:hypothetical protein LguiA_026421 [Lonicera macranthoides]
MECRPLDLILISAEGIKDVNNFTTMDVYAVVSIGGDHWTKQKSPVDKHAGTTPKWNHPMKFTIQESSVYQCSLLFELKSDRALGDKDIGFVSIPIREFLDSASTANNDEKEKEANIVADQERVVTYPIRVASGKNKGTLTFSYKFGEKFTQALTENLVEKSFQTHNEYPVTAYPPPGSVGLGPSYQADPPKGYPMQQPGMMPPPQAYQPGVGYPPPGYGGYPTQPYGGGGYPSVGYGYPSQPQSGYMVQPPQQHKKKKSSKLGLGIGAGLLGGLLVGDMIGEMGEMAAYDAGYDDAMGDF